MTLAVDLFAGAGGWEIALRSAGVEVVGIEIDPIAVQTQHAAGRNGIIVCGDVRDFQPDDYPATILVASPPCQTYSMAGRGAGQPPGRRPSGSRCDARGSGASSDSPRRADDARSGTAALGAHSVEALRRHRARTGPHSAPRMGGDRIRAATQRIRRRHGLRASGDVRRPADAEARDPHRAQGRTRPSSRLRHTPGTIPANRIGSIRSSSRS